MPRSYVFSFSPQTSIPIPKGNNYPAAVDAAAMQKAQKASADFKKALDFIPNLPPDLLTSATIAPERLALADKAVEVAAAGLDVMRRSFDPQRFIDKLAYYRQLSAIRQEIATADTKLKNAMNALGGDMLFDIGNIHEDVEKDNGETVNLGPLRAQLHDFYTHPGARKNAAARKP